MISFHTVFLKDGKLDFSKPSDSLSDQLILIYLDGWGAWVKQLERPKGAKDEVKRLEVRSRRGPKTFRFHIRHALFQFSCSFYVWP